MRVVNSTIAERSSGSGEGAKLAARTQRIVLILLLSLVGLPGFNTVTAFWFRRGAAPRDLTEVANDVVSILLGFALAAVLWLEYTQKRAATIAFQEALIKAKREWELTFDAVPDPIFVIDADRRITRANRALAMVLNLPFQGIIGRPCYEMIHGRTDPPPFCPHQLLLTTGQPAEADVEEPRLGKIFHTTTTPLKSADGTYCSSVHVMRDITDRKLAEIALRRQALIVESMHDAVIAVDNDGNISEWNAAATRLFGYERDEILGRQVVILHPPDNAAAKEASIRSAISSGTPWDDELPFVRKNGEHGVSRTVIVPFRDQSGRLVGSIGVSRDIGERKRAEQQLRESEEKYRQLFENAPYGIFRSTAEGQLLDVNLAFVNMLGYDSRRDVLALNLESDIYEEPTVRQNIISSLGKSGKAAAEVVFKRKDGRSINVRLNGRVLSGADRQPSSFEMIAEDVSDQRNLEQQFLQAQKMEAIGRLSGGIAHDFNNVIMAVNGYAELIMARSQDPAIQRYTEHIIKGGRKASTLTKQLLAFSREQILRPSVLNLQPVLVELCSMLRPTLGEDIELILIHDPETGNVYVDQSQIEQVIMNLVVNARDAMPKGGKLKIEVDNVEVDRTYIQRHPQVPCGKYVVLTVSDTGIGMDPDTQAKIFEPFFTTKAEGMGSGLGLSTAYGIVKQSGGFIWVYSEPGVGTSFKVYLPRVSQQAAAMVEPEVLAPSAEVKNTTVYTILLVDDDREVRSAAREFLEERGYRVLEADNGAAALAACKAHLHAIHVLVTDLIMPVMRGSELAEKIAALVPSIKIVYMSGYTDRSDEIEALGPGVVFLQKPFSLKTLEQKIGTVLSAAILQG